MAYEPLFRRLVDQAMRYDLTCDVASGGAASARGHRSFEGKVCVAWLYGWPLLRRRCASAEMGFTREKM